MGWISPASLYSSTRPESMETMLYSDGVALTLVKCSSTVPA